MFNQVAIVGLGLIGGSMGLALRQKHMAQQVIGYDLRRSVIDQARRMGAIDQGYISLAEAVRGAELIILATPVGGMRTLLQNMASMASPGTVITDVASTKSQVIGWAEELLPDTLSFVGGHPMAGKEVSGVAAADPALFKDRIYCLTPTKKTPSAAIKKVLILIEALGGRTHFLDPSEHDGQVAQISHLPFVASAALMNTVAESEGWGDSALLASSGFRDATRLAAGDPEMYRDICLTNKEAVVHALDAYLAQLSIFREYIRTYDPKIEELFARSQQQRQQWQSAQESKIR